MGIRVLSLFDGMSCVQIALKELGRDRNPREGGLV